MIYDQDNDPYAKLWKEFDRRFSHLLPEDDREMVQGSANCGEEDASLLEAMLLCHYYEIDLPVEFIDRMQGRFSNVKGFGRILDEMRERSKTP
ncbi:hypothetical protein L1O03_06235 [Corynebacterium uropygiale]|uniref:Uncharacterized protein n=1 Tax=Corynebacterium uropygiale TaxID=1775911 RepID=A0A9X1QNR1_9CORY|nr:hypothetical protein [Corynebacterium uropygiale]MCF4006777.1 hypothetical protein [Corynebacterium uropygiale]